MITNTILALDADRIYWHLSDAVAFNVDRAAFFGRECIVAMKLGNQDSAYYRAMIAANFAFQSGFVNRDNEQEN